MKAWQVLVSCVILFNAPLLLGALPVTFDLPFSAPMVTMLGPRKDPLKAPADVVLPVTVPETGHYRLTLFAATYDTNTDSVFYAVDKHKPAARHFGFGAATPDGKKRKTIREGDLGIWLFKAGEKHALSFWTRESGCGLVKVRLTRVKKPMKRFSITPRPGQDETYTITAPGEGNYSLLIEVTATECGPQRNAIVNLNGGYNLKRRIMYPDCLKSRMELMQISFGVDPVTLRLRLDPGATITKMTFYPEPLRLPTEAATYQPPIRPRADHPRVLVNRELLPRIKANLTRGYQAQAWKNVQAQALAPFVFNPPEDAEVGWNYPLIASFRSKAFYYLMTGDKKVGREAVELAIRYFKRFDFGNTQDVCRRTGAAIFAGALVYDYCHDLATPEELRILRERFLAQAKTMEMRWPPFRQHINVGHGNEAQVSRDLLAMAIAVYDEDPFPWQVVSYRMLEEFKPMKNYLYRSGKHYEGIAYGNYRHIFDLTAALLFRRACGYELFTPQVSQVPYYWFYYRAPSGQLFTEGDDYQDYFAPYAGGADVPLLSNCLWPNPKFLADYLQYFSHKSEKFNSNLYALLFLDPDQKPDDNREDLPHAKYFGEPMGDLACRTGWEFGLNSNDVVVTMTGGGVYNRSHQHGDAGAFQLYYRGFLSADLGQYRFFGRPYDMNFAKTSMSHSVMRFLDPEQQGTHASLAVVVTSGIQEGALRDAPATYEEITKHRAKYSRGKTLAWSENPRAPYLQTDLTDAYGDRTKRYVRTMVFLADAPTALIVYDEFDLARDTIQPIWQITSFGTPKAGNNRLDIPYAPWGFPARLTVKTLLPRKTEQRILTGKAASTVEGVYYRPPKPTFPQPSGSRTEILPEKGTRISRFLHVLQPTDGSEPQPVQVMEEGSTVKVVGPDWEVVFTSGKAPAITFRSAPKPVPRAPHHLVYLDGKSVTDIRDGQFSLAELLRAKGISCREEKGGLVFQDVRIEAGKDLCSVGSHRIPLQTPCRRTQDGIWQLSPEDTAGLLNMELRKDHWNGCIYFRSIHRPARFVTAQASKGDSFSWKSLLENTSGSFVGHGTVTGTAVLRNSEKLSKISVRFLRGNVRKARYSLEVSADGKSYEKIFSGFSSGKSEDYEAVSFPARTVSAIRFTFMGNTENGWNSITGIKVE